MQKEILFKEQIRSKLLKGVNIVNEAVSSTLGPKGRNVIFEESIFPTITKDGVTVAQQIFLSDKFENMGAMIVREAAENTNHEAGDGTTSTVVLLAAIFNEASKYIAAGMNPILLKKGIESTLPQINSLLDAQAKPVENKATRLSIATISANNDEEIGNMIVEVIDTVGVDGVVTVQTSNKLKTEVEYVKGTKINSGYESHVFMNDRKRLTCQMKDAAVIISTDAIIMQSQLVPLIQKLVSAGKREMILLADKIEGQALAFLIQNHLMGKFTCVPIKAPSFGDYQKDLIYDLATLTKATVLGENDAKKIEQGEVEDCGTCNSIIIGRDYSIILADGDVAKRIEEVKALLEQYKDDLFKKEKLKERLGKLSGSIANIKVGGASDAEQTEIKYRIEDALNATKSAIEEGVVEGGGMALLRCIPQILPGAGEGKESSAGVEIVKKALEMPLKTIVNNGGGNGEAIVGKALESEIGYNALIEKWENLFISGVIDPKKVVRNTIQNAIATAGILMTADCAIAIKSNDNK